MVDAVIVGARRGVGRGDQLAGLRIARIVRGERVAVRAVMRADRALDELGGIVLQPLALVVIARAQRGAFALVGDRVHHVQRLAERDLGIGERDRGLEAHELAHRVAGEAEIVEQVVLLARGVHHMIPEPRPVLIGDQQIVAIALVHIADRAEHDVRVELRHGRVLERDLGEISVLVADDVLLGRLLRLLDGEEQLDPLLVERADIDLHVLEPVGVGQVDDAGDPGQLRAVAGPAMIAALQRGGGEARHGADRRGEIGRHLEMQHLLDEHREDDVERLLVAPALLAGLVLEGRARLGARPLPPLVEAVPLARDGVHASDRIERGHVERDGEQLDIDRRLRDPAHHQRVGLQEFERARRQLAGLVRQMHGNFPQASHISAMTLGSTNAIGTSIDERTNIVACDICRG